MHTTATPLRSHAARFFSLKNPRSEPYSRGALPKVASWPAQRGLDMVLVRGIPIEHFILGDQTLRAFGEEDFVTEFDWCSHLAAHDQIGMRLEDGINLLGIGNLLPLEHATTGLIDHAFSEPTVVLDLAPQLLECQLRRHVLGADFASVPQPPSGPLHDLLGNADELAIFATLLRLSLRRRHPLDCQHPPPRRARAIAKTLDWPLDCAGQP